MTELERQRSIIKKQIRSRTIARNRVITLCGSNDWTTESALRLVDLRAERDALTVAIRAARLPEHAGDRALLRGLTARYIGLATIPSTEARYVVILTEELSDARAVNALDYRIYSRTSGQQWRLIE